MANTNLRRVLQVIIPASGLINFDSSDNDFKTNNELGTVFIQLKGISPNGMMQSDDYQGSSN